MWIKSLTTGTQDDCYTNRDYVDRMKKMKKSAERLRKMKKSAERMRKMKKSAERMRKMKKSADFDTIENTYEQYDQVNDRKDQARTNKALVQGKM